MYFSRINPRSQWTALKPMEQRCVAQLFVVCGGFEEWSSFEEWLGSGDVASANVLDDGVPIAHWFQFSDAGLLFDARKPKQKACDLIIGSAAQHGFVCAELPLWKALAEAQNAPPKFDWKVDPKAVGRVLRPEGTAEANWRAIQDRYDGVSSDPGDPTRRFEPGPVKVWVDGKWEAGTITSISYGVTVTRTKQSLEVSAGRLAPVEEPAKAKKKPQSRKK